MFVVAAAAAGAFPNFTPPPPPPPLIADVGADDDGSVVADDSAGDAEAGVPKCTPEFEGAEMTSGCLLLILLPVLLMLLW